MSKQIRIVYTNDEPVQAELTAVDLRNEFDAWENTGRNWEIAADYELWLEVEVIRARRKIAELEARLEQKTDDHVNAREGIMSYFTYKDGHFYFENLKIVGTCHDVAKTLDEIHGQTMAGYEATISYFKAEMVSKDKRIAELEARLAQIKADHPSIMATENDTLADFDVAWKQVITGDTHDISTLWDDFDEE